MPDTIGQSATDQASAFVIGEILGAVKAVQRNQEQARTDNKEQRDEVVKRLDSIDADIDKRFNAIDLRVSTLEKFSVRMSTIAMILSGVLPIVTSLLVAYLTGSF